MQKAFISSGSDAIVYNRELYAGAVNHDLDLPDVGVSGNVVLTLAKIVPKDEYYKMYYDNCSTAYPWKLLYTKWGYSAQEQFVQLGYQVAVSSVIRK